MKLSEIMTRDVVVIGPDDTLQTAAKKRRDRNIGVLPVCDGENLSDRDITIRALAVISWMWIPTLLTLGIGILLGWAIFGNK